MAGDVPHACEYLLTAGRLAIRRSAYLEATMHLSNGVELLQELPHSLERLERELDFQTALGPNLGATKGYGSSDTERAYLRAREICEEIGARESVHPHQDQQKHAQDDQNDLQDHQNHPKKTIRAIPKRSPPGGLLTYVWF